KSPGIRVVELVFHGRKDRASCLWAYLQRNMIDKGGWLEEVLWIVNTNNDEDLQHLEDIVATDPSRHRKADFSQDILTTNTYYKAWQHLQRGKYYVKIDDDIVWFDHAAIPRLVSTKIEYPDAFFVSANIINNPPLGFLHLHNGALRLFFPEVSRPKSLPGSWKPSEHGHWVGPRNFTWPLDQKPPYDGHRWLKAAEDHMLVQTTAMNIAYEIWGASYNSWAITAQQHYSLLDAIERAALDRYIFRTPWYMHGQRIRINLMCVYADDILDQVWPPETGDEDNIAIHFPILHRRPVIIEGTAMAAHYQYQGQPGLEKTDLLQRYQMLAEEQLKPGIRAG
ncbi:uncharacterized protein B0I36DRAFT_244834, partial [Microdochium trichocladiopsis]